MSVRGREKERETAAIFTYENIVDCINRTPLECWTFGLHIFYKSSKEIDWFCFIPPDMGSTWRGSKLIFFYKIGLWPRSGTPFIPSHSFVLIWKGSIPITIHSPVTFRTSSLCFAIFQERWMHRFRNSTHEHGTIAAEKPTKKNNSQNKKIQIDWWAKWKAHKKDQCNYNSHTSNEVKTIKRKKSAYHFISVWNAQISESNAREATEKKAKTKK